MSLSECAWCGGHIPLGPLASNCCVRCGKYVMTGPSTAKASMEQTIATLTRERDEARRERDRLDGSVRCDAGVIQDAISAMGNGADEDRWPSGTHVITALIAERDQLKARAEKAEGDARWMANNSVPADLGEAQQWIDRIKPYEEKQP